MSDAQNAPLPYGVQPLEYAAEALGITTRQVHEQCTLRRIHGSYRQGKQWLIHKATFDDWAARKRAKQQTVAPLEIGSSRGMRGTIDE